MLKFIGRHSVPFMLLLALSATGIGLYLAPSHQEIALMQMNDLDFSVALRNFTTLRSEGDRSINVLAPLVNLNIYYGNDDQAVALLQSFIADHPRSIEARKRLADLYKNTFQYEHYCQVLEELQNLSPSAATLRELADTYNFLGRYKDEMNTLAQLIDSKGYEPEEADYIKLASYYRIDNQPDEAVSTIRDYIEDHYYKVGTDAVTLAVQLLLEQGETHRAYSLAHNYLRKRGDEESAIALSAMFESRGQLTPAYDILSPFMTDMEQSPALEQQAIDIMLAQKKDDEVYAMLSAQHTKMGALAPPLAVSLTDLAVTRGDYPMIESMIRTQNLEMLPESSLLRYADMAYQSKRPDLARLIQSKLSENYLRESPALAAVLAVAIDDTPKTMAVIEAMPQDELLPEKKIMFARLYIEHNMPKQAFAMLDGMPIADILDLLDATQYAELYLDVGASAKAEQILAQAAPTSTPEIRDSIDQILLLFAAGEGKREFVEKRLADYKGNANDFWPDVYDIAIEYHRDEIALAIAAQMFKLEPSEANRLQLGETLMINHRFADALNYLQSMVVKDPAARALYLDAMATWSTETGGPLTLSESQKKTLSAAVDSIVNDSSASIEERQDLAYVLEQAGFLDQAADVLIKLAEGHAYDSPNVDDLIGFWQDHPSNRAIDWIETRARHASGSPELAFWLTNLNDMEYPQAVVSIMRDKSDMSPAVADQYIEALADLHDKDELESVLDKIIDTETGIPRLKSLATTAQDEDADSAAEKAWRKVYAIDSHDDEAAMQIGLIDYDTNHYAEAKTMLNQYLQNNTGDYHVNLAYADILQQDDENADAMPYFQRALKQLSAIKERDQSMEEDEAYLLYRTDHITESLAYFHRLLEKYPNDKELRADFAEVLMEVGKYDEASSLLSH